MTEVEQRLRDMLTRYAYDAPDGNLMLSRVRQTATRRRRRRTRALTGGAALAVVLAASGAVALAGRSAPVPPKLSVGLGQDVSSPEFVAGSPIDLTFPFTPPATPVPGTRPTLTLVAGRPTLQYLPSDLTATGPSPGPSVDLSSDPSIDPSARAPSTGPPKTESKTGTKAGSIDAGGNAVVPDSVSRTSDVGSLPSRAEEAATDPVTVVASGSPWTDGPFTPAITLRGTTVHGCAGVIGERQSTDGPPDYVLTWTESGGLWVGISAPETISTVDLTQFASELTRQPITQPGPFDFDLVPAGFVVDNINASTVTFRPATVPASADFVGKLVVSLDAEPAATQDGEPVKVGGRAGWLHTVDDVAMLRIDEGSGLSLTVQVPERLRIDERDLLRFAAGVHATSVASPARG